MTVRRTLWSGLAPGVLTAALALLGCAGHDRLTPASAANQVEDMPDAAHVQTQGVLITALVNQWPGLEQVRNKVTPVHISIVNHSGKPLRIQYHQLALVDIAGERFAALPPFKIKGAVSQPITVQGVDPMVRGWTHRGYSVAPYYGSVYAGVPVAGSTFVHDPLYYDRYYRSWERVELPTPEMLRYALPEGVIAPGGRVEGFVYFERIGDRARHVRLQSELIDADTGQAFGTATIPFDVSKD